MMVDFNRMNFSVPEDSREHDDDSDSESSSQPEKPAGHAAMNLKNAKENGNKSKSAINVVPIAQAQQNQGISLAMVESDSHSN